MLVVDFLDNIHPTKILSNIWICIDVTVSPVIHYAHIPIFRGQLGRGGCPYPTKLCITNNDRRQHTTYISYMGDAYICL